MFDNLSNAPESMPAENKKTEDIFAGVDNAGQPAMPKPPVFQPKDPAAELPAEIPVADNRKYFLLGAAVLGVLFIIGGGWYALKSFSSAGERETAGEITEEPQSLSDEFAGQAGDVGRAAEAGIPAGEGAVLSQNEIATTTAVPESAATGTAQSGAGLDSDDDGLTDEEEKNRGTDPAKVDSDSDDLFDYEEVKVYNTNPLLSDSDSDGFADGQEIKGGYNPLGAGKLFDPTNPAGSLDKK